MRLPKNATLSPQPFKISIPQSDVDDFKALLRLSKLPPATYEGTDEKFGVTNKWMKETKAYWESSFDWRKHEEEINKLPQYTVPVKNKDGTEYNIHFIGIISENPDAVPLLLLHGWPGSFVEFLDIAKLLSTSTSPSFNIIVPSFPGYAFSSQAPLDKEFGLRDIAYLMNELMVGLGFNEANGGYVSQGGDLGSVVSTILQSEYADCRAIHLNAIFIRDQRSMEGLDEIDIRGLERSGAFMATGLSYAMEHATRPSTIGHALASNPLALLAWIGEKLLEWTDEPLPIEKTLQLITLWWFTETFPRSIYPYREIFAPPQYSSAFKKPVGYSLFPKETVIRPQKWAEIDTGGALIWFKRHDKGGHFPAMEVTELLAADIIAFVELLKKEGKLVVG